jgi:hypothetical protein
VILSKAEVLLILKNSKTTGTLHFVILKIFKKTGTKLRE